ncbi:MAG: phospholipid-binding protein MlaC [Gammaproteobacteria bacterium]
MKNLTKSLFVTLTLILFMASARAETTALEVVKNTSVQVIERLTNESGNIEDDPQAVKSAIDEFITPNFDFPKMSRWILGKKNWKSATSDQQERFTNAFQNLLIKTYSKALVASKDVDINYLPVRMSKDKKKAIVNAEVDRKNGSKVIPLSFRLYQAGDTWKVYDVSIDNVSLVSTYRKTFKDEIKRKSLDDLISKLESRAESAS